MGKSIGTAPRVLDGFFFGMWWMLLGPNRHFRGTISSGLGFSYSNSNMSRLGCHPHRSSSPSLAFRNGPRSARADQRARRGRLLSSCRHCPPWRAAAHRSSSAGHSLLSTSTPMATLVFLDSSSASSASSPYQRPAVLITACHAKWSPPAATGPAL